jgi:hypothetical protein
MPLTTAQKFRIGEGAAIYTLNEPKGFKAGLGPLPARVSFTKDPSNATQVHWFVKDKAQMEDELNSVLRLIKGDVICWIYYPKGSSKMQTDLTRDKGWDNLLNKDMQWISLVSFDDTWSAFGMRENKKKESAKSVKPKERPVLQYVDPATKSVTLPEDVAAAFKKHKKLEAYFQSLAFSHKKEYIEWIVSAKKEETRQKRIQGALELLEKGAKNPYSR